MESLKAQLEADEEKVKNLTSDLTKLDESRSKVTVRVEGRGRPVEPS